MEKELHKIKIESLGNPAFAEVYVDGEKEYGVVSVDYHIAVNEMPTVTIKQYCDGFEGEAVLDRQFICQTLGDAIKTLTEFSKVATTDNWQDWIEYIGDKEQKEVIEKIYKVLK